MAKLKIHPFADTYPPMSEAELEALTEDIKARGLQRTIVLYEGQILDGRNRYLACERAGVEPSFVDYEGDDPLGQVNSLNLNRDLTGAQRAIVAARQWMMNGDGKPGPKSVKSLPNSAASFAKLFRTTKPSIIQARDLLADAHDLAAQVEGCNLSLAAAHGQLQERQKQAARKAKDAERVSEYRDAISSGETTLEKALQEIMERERAERENVTRDAEARQLWLVKLADVVRWFEESVATRNDDHLAWYTTPGEPGTETALTAQRVAEVGIQIQRLLALTFGERHDHDSPPQDGPARGAGKGAPATRANARGR